jgi:hypothetical protein
MRTKKEQNENYTYTDKDNEKQKTQECSKSNPKMKKTNDFFLKENNCSSATVRAIE